MGVSLRFRSLEWVTKAHARRGGVIERARTSTQQYNNHCGLQHVCVVANGEVQRISRGGVRCALRAMATRDTCAGGARRRWADSRRQSSAHSAHRWAVARPSKSSTAEIRAHPDFRVKNTEKYVSLRST